MDIRNSEFPKDLDVTMSVNGKVIPQEQLGVSWPCRGDQILIIPNVHGGDTKGILRAVLLIVVAVVATIYGGPLGASLYSGLGLSAGTTAFLGSMTIMLVGGMLVNAILPPPKPKLDTLDNMNMGGSQTYSWAPQTMQQPGIIIPKCYGVNRLYGNIIAANLESNGSNQLANILIGLGYGPVKALDDVKINDQPAGNFKKVDVFSNLGDINQPVIEIFDNTKIEYPLSVKVNYNSKITYTTIGSKFDRLEIELTFPQGHWAIDLGTGYYWPWPIDIRVEIKRHDDTDETHWVSITHQVVATDTFTTHVNSGPARWSAGKWIQVTVKPPTDIDPGVTEEHWVEFKEGSTDYRSVHAGKIYYDSVTKSYGYWRWMAHGEEYRTVDTKLLDYVTLPGKLQTLFRQTFTTDVPSAGAYDIRISNLSTNPLYNVYGDMYLSAVREVENDKFTYPRQVLVGIHALATDQLSGSLRFSCICDGAFVRVWDGTQWTYDASSNPAWVVWDILTQPVIDTVKSDELLPDYEWYDPDLGISFRVALKKDGSLRYDGIDPQRLDLVKFKEWADWCHELVPDGNGNGGTEKRITFNAVFDTRTSMWEAAMQVCQTGRAVLVWNGIHLTVAVDKPSTPVQMFTVGNINIDTFKQTFLPMSDRATEVIIDFANKEKNYERDKLTVFDPHADYDSPVESSIELFGITKSSEAHRAGRYRLYNNRYLTRTAEIEVDIDAIACTLGDVVLIQHDVPQWGYGGRLASADLNSVTLDREVTIETGKSYTVMVRLADDSILSKAVTNAPGNSSAITVSTPFSTVPAQYDVYAFGESEKVTKPFRIMNLTRTEDLRCTLELVEYNESIYSCDTDPMMVLPTANYSDVDPLPPVRDLALDELLLARPGGGLEDVIDVNFTRPQSAYYQQAEIWYNNGSGWIYAGSTPSDHFRIPGVNVGTTYHVAVVTVNVIHGRQTIQNSPQASIATLGKLDPPSNVTDFAATQNGQFVNFSWTHIPDADVSGYEIREGALWEGARTIVSGISMDQYSWQAEMNGTYRFWIKAIDTSGIYSTTATNVDLTLRKIDEDINVVLSQDEINKVGGPDGEKTNLAFVVNPENRLTMPHMLLDTEVSSWTNTDPKITNYAGSQTLNAEYITNPIDTLKTGVTWTRILDTFDAFDRGATDISYPDRTDLTYPPDTDMHITMLVTKEMYLCYSTDNIQWSPWEKYFGTVQHDLRYVKVKYMVSVGSTTSVFNLLNLFTKLDVPDVELIIPNFSVSAGTGNDILFSTYNEQFYGVPVVTATVIGSTVNKIPVISNKSTSGFHIDLRDKTDASVAGIVDIRVSGY